ncbi:MAG: PEP-CTERM sorting domain-containing protein [Caldimonas sp.]
MLHGAARHRQRGRGDDDADLLALSLGVTSGSFSETFDTSLAATYNPAFIILLGESVAAVESALYTGMQLGQTYLNIHTAAFPGGEIRGFLVLAPVPEPETFALLLAGLGAIGFARRRRRPLA